MEYSVELKGIRKEFPGVVALDGVSVGLRPGRVHALVGENGAGKSTLMKILSGTYTEYEGELWLEGQPVSLKGEKAALDLGIAIVAQELSPIDELTVAENIFLGREPKRTRGVMNRGEMLAQTARILEGLQLQLDPGQRMGTLSIAQKQMVEIAKAISRNCKVLIMDEPTSALTEVEAEILFGQIRRLREEGLAIVFISHKLDEVFAICDDVSVLRDGKLIGSDLLENVTQNELIAMMVGREMNDIYPPVRPQGTEPLLQAEGYTGEGFQDVSFTLNKGEILGFAGMMGAGRSEVMRAVFGLDRREGGTLTMHGKRLKIRASRDAIRSGIAMVTEDRGTYGLVLNRSIKENVILPSPDIFSKKGFLQKKVIRGAVEGIMQRIKVRAPGQDTVVGTLSGGNQQKVVLSKWLVRDVEVLIMDEPTRGIDVGAKQEIYRLITELAGKGMAVILISSEMPEVLAMSHRVMVMANGRLVGEMQRGEASADKIMKCIVESGAANG